MPYRPPLVPHEIFVADPPELPVRAPGERGLSALARADVVAVEPHGVTLKALTTAGETLAVQVSAAGEGIIRVRLSQDTEARSRSARALPLVRPDSNPVAQAVLAQAPGPSVGAVPAQEVDMLSGGRRIRIDAGAAVAELTLDPWHLRFVDAAGRTLVEQSRGEHDISGRLRTLPFGRSTVDGAVAAYHESFNARADERFVGLGEKFTVLDKRGQRALMWNFDAFGSESDRSYKNVPLYLSSRGYGILVDSGMPIEFDMCQSTHSCVQILVPDDLIDYYLLAGPAPVDVLDRYDRLTSRPQLPPKWAFGTWMSSGFFVDTQERVLARARRIRDRGIPCDVLHLDCYWQVAGHWSDQRWDAENFPDPAGMLAELAALNFKVSLWMNPYVSHQSPVFAEADGHGYFLRTPDGRSYVADVWHGSQPASGIVDFTNPEATAWFQDLLRPLLRQGVAAFKTDFAEGVPVDALAANGMTGTELHNVYSLLFNDTVAEVTREVHGHGLVWARSSYLGGQRHSAQWSGDSMCGYTALATTLRGGLSYGLSGMPFWSHDAGGFTGTPSPDLYIRWSQFGAFSPLVRFHGTTSRLPWDFPAEAERVVVDALRLRYRLMPYLYSAAVDSARTGAPLMRALLVDSPEDPAAWTAELEFRLGPDLLVAPMVDPDGERSVYLPAGQWVDHADGSVLEGGRHVTVRAPLEKLPLYVRRGALIPLCDLTESIPDGPFGDLTLASWGGLDARTVIRDVDGDTVVTAVRDGGRYLVTTDGPAAIRAVEFPHTADAPGTVLVNGRP